MIKFTAHSSAPIQYLNADAKHLLQIIGKDENSPQGIITEEQLPDALHALEQAIEHDGVGSEVSEHVAAHGSHQDAHEHEEHDGQPRAAVPLKKRALPLLQLLRSAHQNKEYVIWEA